MRCTPSPTRALTIGPPRDVRSRSSLRGSAPVRCSGRSCRVCGASPLGSPRCRMPRFRRCGGILVGNGAARAKSWPSAGHVGVAAGPVVANGGDYFGRTVNLASRIAGRTGAGQVLVSESVAKAAAPDVRFVELGEVNLKGFAKPVKVFEARRIPLDEGRLDL